MLLSMNDSDHYNICIKCHYVECHYAECRDLFNVMLNVIMLSVIMLNVIMLSVVASILRHIKRTKVDMFLIFILSHA